MEGQPAVGETKKQAAQLWDTEAVHQGSASRLEDVQGLPLRLGRSKPGTAIQAELKFCRAGRGRRAQWEESRRHQVHLGMELTY